MARTTERRGTPYASGTCGTKRTATRAMSLSANQELTCLNVQRGNVSSLRSNSESGIPRIQGTAGSRWKQMELVNGQRGVPGIKTLHCEVGASGRGIYTGKGSSAAIIKFCAA